MKTFFKRIGAFGLVLTMLLAQSACGKEPQAGTSENTSGEKPAASTSTEKPKLAMIFKVVSEEFYQKMQQGATEKAKELGYEIEFFGCNSADDVEGQLTLLENCISKGYAAIGLCPMSVENCNNAIVEATKKGVYVVNIDDPLNWDGLKALGGAVYGQVGADNLEFGQLGAQFVVDKLGKNGGKVAIIEGKSGIPASENRRDGAKQVFEAAGYEVVDSQPADWDRTKAFDLATNFITKNPDLKAIFVANALMGLGAQEAVEKSGLDIMVTAVNDDGEALQSIKDGKMDATVAQPATDMGAEAVRLMVEAVESGAKPDPNAQRQESSSHGWLIDASNVQEYMK